jgi:hypothetical protein
VSTEDQLAAAVDALHIGGPTEYWWFGERFAVPPPPDAASDRWVDLAAALELRLYADLYCTGGAAPAAPTRVEPSPRWPSEAVMALTRAVTGRRPVERGWTVTGRNRDELIVRRDGLTLRAVRGDVARRSGNENEPGVALRLPAVRIGTPDGFFVVYGGVTDAGRTPARLDRFYANVRGEGRPGFVRRLTGELNRRDVPFRLKVINDPSSARCDSAILYTAADRRDEVADLVSGVAARCVTHLRRRVPVFSHTLAPGIGFAEDPQTDVSFGTHRCRIVAEALIGARRRGLSGREAMLSAIAEAFAAAGLDVRQLHLNPASDPLQAPVAFG